MTSLVNASAEIFWPSITLMALVGIALIVWGLKATK